jgi:hypothetical protein
MLQSPQGVMALAGSVILGVWVLLSVALKPYGDYLFVALAVCGLIGTWYLAEGPARQQRQWKAEGRCTRCGYDLTGNVSGTCPECGTPIT